jgi:Kef-type K+ transport system membrane component KefB
MDAVVGIVAFGLLLCLVHAAPPGDVRPPTPTEWAVITIAIGVVGGIVYHLFLAGERNPDRLFIALTAAITLASGTAAYARLSPLLPTMLIGAILVNTSRGRREIAAVIHRVHRPLYLVLLVFAGAAWRPSERAWLVPIAAYLVVRPLAKIGSARLAARLGGTSRSLGPDWGYGLVGQGSLAAAIALNYRLLDNSVLPNIVFTAAVVSVLLTDLVSARLVQATVRRHRRRHAAAVAGAPAATAPEIAAATAADPAGER